MLRQLKLSNFKPFDPTSVDLTMGRITVFIGANGVGKSSDLDVSRGSRGRVELDTLASRRANAEK